MKNTLAVGHYKLDRRHKDIAFVKACDFLNKPTKVKKIKSGLNHVRAMTCIIIIAASWYMCWSNNQPKPQTAQAQTEEVPEREVISRESRSFESADIPKDYVDPNIKEEKALAELMGNESGGEPGRINKTSLACGVGQAYPCTKLYPHATRAWILKNKIVKGDKWYIPNQGKEFEIDWMKNYIKNRYGTAQEALRFWKSQSPHWY